MVGRIRQPAKDGGVDIWGDSLVQSSAGGVAEADRWPQRLGTLFSPRRVACNWGVGGERSDQIAARQLVYPAGKIQGIWAGRNDVSQGTPQATTLAQIASMVAHVGDTRFFVLSVIAKTDGTEPAGSAPRDAILALNAALAAAYPANFISVFTALDDPALRNDGLHLTVAGQRIVEAAVFQFLTTKEW